jgi:hypothetical protein
LKLSITFRTSALALAAGVVVSAAACGGGSGRAITKVFLAPPWQGDESLTYQLKQRDENLGTCILRTDVEAEPGHTRLLALCGSPDGNNRDDREVMVDSRTLRPLVTHRVITDAKKGTKTQFSGNYEEPVVRLTLDRDGKVSATTRELPQPTAKSPDPGYYDDESLNWVVRGIDLRNGFKGAYRDVNAGNARVFTVTLYVDGTEKVQVPAGEFAAWKVRVETESITQLFWVDTAAPHRVVKARIERTNWELTKIE